MNRTQLSTLNSCFEPDSASREHILLAGQKRISRFSGNFPIKGLCVLVFLLLSLSLNAQEKWANKGDQLFEQREYVKAIEMYDWSLKKNDLADTKAKLGDCYRKLNRYAEAEKWYQAAHEQGLTQPEFIIHYAQVLLAEEKLDEVTTLIASARALHPSNKQLTNFDVALGERDFLMQDSSRYEVKKVPINSRNPDFSPTFFKDGLVFASARKQKSSVVYTSKTDEAPLPDLFFAQDRGEGAWGRPTKLSGDINSVRSDGPACFTKDGTIAYFTRDDNLANTKAGNSNELRKLKLFQATAKDDNWNQVTPLPFNSDAYAIAHPALSPDEKHLYFASDMPGGAGGMDLYRVSRSGDSWGQPENLGEDVNTSDDELFPFISAEGILYFASDGHIGLGNLDVFTAIQKGGEWTRVRNLGFPVNSTRDDFGLIIDVSGERGFFSSNRGKNPRNDDIYEFFTLLPKFECTPQETNQYTYRLYEKSSLSPEDLADLPLVYEWDLGDGNKQRGLEAVHTYGKAGAYEVKLNVIDTTSGFVFMNETSHTLIIEDIRQVYIEVPEIVETNATITFDGTRSNPEGCTIERYFWDFGKGRSEGKSIETHTFTQPGTYTVSLGVMGIDPETGDECLACSSLEIEVLAHAQYEEKLENLGVQASRKNLNEVKRLQGVKPSLIDNVGEKNYAIRDYENEDYRVQLIISPVQLNMDSANFKGMEGVSEFFDDPNYIYTVGNAKDPRKLFPVYRKAVDLEFEAAMVIMMVEDKIITGHDSTFWMKLPHQGEPSLISVVQGQLTDLNGTPVQAKIYFDDLINSKVYATTTSDKNGEYYIELPNGKMYGFHAEADGFYPISDFIDLRKEDTRIEYQGKIQMVSKTQMVESGAALRVNNIFFRSNSTELEEASEKEMDRLLRILIENPGLKVVIEGYTDDVGSPEYNQTLSLNRAKAVLKHLVLKGFNIDNLEAKGFGETNPVAPNSTEEGRAQNRRVEVRFITD